MKIVLLRYTLAHSKHYTLYYFSTISFAAMKFIQKTIAVLALCLFTVISLHAQSNLIIHSQNDTEKTAIIAGIRKITFPDDNLVLQYTDNSTESVALSSIRKITFNEVSGIENLSPATSNELTVYPNPASEIIYLTLTNEGSNTVYLYNTNGILLIEQQISNESQGIYVGNLPKGIYIVRVGNQATKFCKI